MWDSVVSDRNTELQIAFRVLIAMVGEHPITTAGIVLLFILLWTMLAAEIVDGRDTAVKVDVRP